MPFCPIYPGLCPVVLTMVNRNALDRLPRQAELEQFARFLEQSAI